MRRNNLARNLERFELQRVIAEDDRLYKIDMEFLKKIMLKKNKVEWITQAATDRRAELNPDPNSPVTYYDRELTLWEKWKGTVYVSIAIALVITIAKLTYIFVDNGGS